MIDLSVYYLRWGSNNMYSAILMVAMTTGGSTPLFHPHHGCYQPVAGCAGVSHSPWAGTEAGIGCYHYYTGCYFGHGSCALGYTSCYNERCGGWGGPNLNYVNYGGHGCYGCYNYPTRGCGGFPVNHGYLPPTYPPRIMPFVEPEGTNKVEPSEPDKGEPSEPAKVEPMNPVPTSAKLLIRVPSNAKLFIDDQLIAGSGSERAFFTPALEKGESYFYAIRVEANPNAPPSLTKKVYLKAGQEVTLSFDPRNKAIVRLDE